MATNAIEIPVKFETTIKPKSFKHLSSEPIELSFDGVLALEGVEIAHKASITKLFKVELESRIKAQLSHLEDWMKERDQIISAMEAKVGAIKKRRFPRTQTELPTFEHDLDEVAQTAKKLKEFPAEYQKILKIWGGNCCLQQGSIAMQLVVRKALKKAVDDKAFRIRTAQVAKGALIISGFALGVAATILTGGLAGVALGSVVGLGIAVSGVSTLGQIALNVRANWDLEKRALVKLEGDLEGVRTAFGKVESANSSLAKHLTELMTLMRVRENDIAELQKGVDKASGQIQAYCDQIRDLRHEDAILNTGDIEDRFKAFNQASSEIRTLKLKIVALEAKNRKGQALIDELKDMKANLDALARFEPNTILTHVKGAVKDLDSVMETANMVGGNFQSIGLIAFGR